MRRGKTQRKGAEDAKETQREEKSDPGATVEPWNMTYDAYNRMLTMTDPMDNRTTNTFDANGNLVKTVLYGELNDLFGTTGAPVLLKQTEHAYDAMNRRVRTDEKFFNVATGAAIGDGFATTQWVYSDASQVIRVTDDNGNATLTSYDGAHRPSSVIDAKGNTTSYEYDGNSNVVKIIEREKSDLGAPDEVFTTNYAFDRLDRQTSTTDNAGNVNQSLYDARNNRVKTIDALGNGITMSYDGLNRQLQTSRELRVGGAGMGAVTGQIVTSQAWDDSSRLVSQTDDNGNATTYVYDPLNRKTAEVYADATAKNMTYDNHGNQLTMTDARGVVATTTYDLLNRATGRSIALAAGVGGTTSESYHYDGASRLTYAQDNDSLVTRGYDSLNRVTSETLNSQTTACVYDGVGNLTQCAYPGGRVVTTSFDELNRKKTISDASGSIATYSYRGRGRVERRDYGNGTRCDYEYDSVKRMTRTTHKTISGGTIFDDRSYGWDPKFNKISRTDNLAMVTRTFTYDSVSRLVQSTQGLFGTVNYALDGVGNRSSVTGSGPDAGAYTMDASTPEPADRQMNQYTSVPAGTRTYDKNGDLTSAPGLTSVAYDYRNQMISASTPSGVATYAYDALGRRISKTFCGVTTRYLYHGWRVVAEQDGSGALQATYVYGKYIDEVLEMTRAGLTYFFHTDDLYSVVKVTDASRMVAEKYDYSDYGLPVIMAGVGGLLTQSAIENPYLFNGRNFDRESGLYYYRSRYYDSLVGVFTCRDPIGVWGDPINFGHEYLFVGHRPAVLLDPFGLDSLVFDGYKIIWYDDDGNVIDSFDACSGVEGITDTSRPMEGPIPEGSYWIDPDEKDTDPHVWQGASWGQCRARIRWRFMIFSKRQGFFIHGGDSPGSAGCIDIMHNDVNLLPKLKKLRSKIKLTVDYPKEGPPTNFDHMRPKPPKDWTVYE